jgi:hypothetical protein
MYYDNMVVIPVFLQCPPKHVKCPLYLLAGVHAMCVVYSPRVRAFSKIRDLQQAQGLGHSHKKRPTTSPRVGAFSKEETYNKPKGWGILKRRDLQQAHS